MAVLLIEKAFQVRFDDLDHTTMDIKPDVHTVRVLYRLGVSAGEKQQHAIDAARRISPSYPGLLDAPLWVVGRQWCDAVSPKCSECPLTDICIKRNIC